MFGFRKKLTINHLRSGGLITNYYCTSECAHCLYNCSPRWKKYYIDETTTRKNLEKIKSLGCFSIHIGGGEPFLQTSGLERVLRMATQMGVRIEYVETNSSWFKSKESARETLMKLKESGLSTLLVSISPFHNEHIAFYKVKGVIAACRQVGISVFPWMESFYSEIDHMDDRISHWLSEYVEVYGEDYIRKIPYRYWVHFGGRALRTYGNLMPGKDWRSILSSETGGCSELQDVSHFHLDLFGNYIPGLCAGLAIERDDLGSPLSPEKYPFLSTLFDSGINGFFQMVVSEFGFEPAGRYISKCHLCSDIRRFLVLDRNVDSKELQPVDHYRNG